MFPLNLVFIKLIPFVAKKPFVLIVYQNELKLECTPIVKVVFRVAKQEDGRRDGHIHIVYGIGRLAETL
jgi:hypothetical protein